MIQEEASGFLLPLARPFASPTPPTTNTAPNVGADPHSDPRNSPTARQQKSDFLQTGGMVTDVCLGAPCVAP